MDEVERIYNEGKLLMRAMDQPGVTVGQNGKFYECESWVNEFDFLMNDGLNSLSTTLIVPGVGVKNYKNIGFLINSDMADCFHIAKSDSGSCGSMIEGDFMANKSDFDRVIELANYIKQTNATVMNEVNVNIKIDAVVGLFINKCTISDKLLKKIYVVKKMLENVVGIDYPIYLYDWDIGKLDRIDLTKEQEEELISGLASKTISCWPDSVDEPFFVSIETSNYHK